MGLWQMAKVCQGAEAPPKPQSTASQEGGAVLEAIWAVRGPFTEVPHESGCFQGDFHRGSRCLPPTPVAEAQESLTYPPLGLAPQLRLALCLRSAALPPVAAQLDGVPSFRCGFPSKMPSLALFSNRH